MELAVAVGIHGSLLLVRTDEQGHRSPDQEITGRGMENNTIEHTGPRPCDVCGGLAWRAIPLVEKARGTHVIDDAKPLLADGGIHAGTPADDLLEEKRGGD